MIFPTLLLIVIHYEIDLWLLDTNDVFDHLFYPSRGVYCWNNDFLKLTIACYLFIKGFRCAFIYNIVVQVHFLLTLNAYSEFCCKFLCDCDMV